jgi:aryl-alcohol dehydrogenase-like predicted oxidoreductase
VRYTLFGRTGLRVSELSLGAMTIGDDWGWGAGKATSARILDAYATAGGDFVDTANNYTRRAVTARTSCSRWRPA